MPSRSPYTTRSKHDRSSVPFAQLVKIGADRNKSLSQLRAEGVSLTFSVLVVEEDSAQKTKKTT